MASLALTGFAWVAPQQARPRPTYLQDVEPIIRKHCLPCHTEGQVGPFPFTNYEQTSRHGLLIRKQALSQDMPPHKLQSDLGVLPLAQPLTPAETRILQYWINDQMPRGEGEENPPPISTIPWQLSAADVVFESHPETPEVRSEGVQYWITQAFSPPEGFAFTAFDLKPASPDALRYAVLAIIPSSVLDQGEFRESVASLAMKGKIVGVWAPGFPYFRVPKGSKVIVPAGHKLAVMVSYRPGGRPKNAGFQLRFASADTASNPVELISLDRAPFVIKAKTSPTLTLSYTVPRDSEIIAITPIMRFFVVRTRITLEYPDGRSELYVGTKRWDPYWLGNYMPPEPVKVPKGTKIVCSTEYANDENCTMNINRKPEDVHSGPGVRDEVFQMNIALGSQE